jgi:hypothetical protein
MKPGPANETPDEKPGTKTFAERYMLCKAAYKDAADRTTTNGF